MIKLVSYLFYRLMARYDHLPSDDCLPRLNGGKIWQSSREMQIAYLEYTYRLDSSKHYQIKPN